MVHSGKKPFFVHSATTLALKLVPLESICEPTQGKSLIVENSASIPACDLKKHLLTLSGEKPYSCPQCTYSCTTSGHLQQHMTTHSWEQHFSCDHCNYSCNNAGSLKKHMRQHSGEKPFACNQYKTCTTLSSLRTHMYSHTGKKPYACKKCNYMCIQPFHLRRHMKKHPSKASTLRKQDHLRMNVALE